MHTSFVLCEFKKKEREKLTRELRFVILDVFENVCISVGDDKPMLEDLNDGSNVEVLWPIVYWLFKRGSGLGNPCALKEFTPDDARVANRWLIDCQHVICQAVCDDEAPATVLRAHGVLIENK